MSTYEQKTLKKAGDGTNNFVTSYTLTSSFADIAGGNAYIDCANWDEMTIYIEYDPAVSGEILDTRVDFSADQSLWCPESDESVTSGVATQLAKTRQFTSTTDSAAAIPVISVPVNDRWARIMAKDNVGTTGAIRVQIIMSKLAS
jgi:hypothetical protein